MEVLQRLIRERLGMEVSFGAGSCLLPGDHRQRRWRASATLSPCGTMPRCICCWSPASRAAALPLASVCPTDQLDLNWQRLIFTHLLEKAHLGVLTGSPITDIKITLLAGRAHEKHTEGGDFRQATYRAVRQGLMQAESVLLEPWYRLPAGNPRPAGGPGHDGLAADGRRGGPAGDRGRGNGPHRHGPGGGPAGLCPGGGGLHPGPGAAVLRPGGVFPLRGRRKPSSRPWATTRSGTWKTRRIPCSAPTGPVW